MAGEFAVYPNVRGRSIDERGYLRWGLVADNVDTRAMDIHGFCPAGKPAVVTEEVDHLVKFYIWTVTRETMFFPGVPVWVGPFSSISEDIENSEESKGDKHE